MRAEIRYLVILVSVFLLRHSQLPQPYASLSQSIMKPVTARGTRAARELKASAPASFPYEDDDPEVEPPAEPPLPPDPLPPLAALKTPPCTLPGALLLPAFEAALLKAARVFSPLIDVLESCAGSCRCARNLRWIDHTNHPRLAVAWSCAVKWNRTIVIEGDRPRLRMLVNANDGLLKNILHPG